MAERTTASINHTIAKQIVQIAKIKELLLKTLKAPILLKKGKKFRTRVGKWSFNQLRQYISYKAFFLNGVPVVFNQDIQARLPTTATT